ncbi:uncharacterized protein LOC144650775 [Oculina patagonica]
MQIHQRGIADLYLEEVRTALKRFDDLEKKDEKGYTALLKACSLNSMSPHVMQHLIDERNVDLNCPLPADFENHHTVAKQLIPGMSALSVALKSGNAQLVRRFKKRIKEYEPRSADVEGNTALHYCVHLISKVGFECIFPLLTPTQWKEMQNREGKNPLDISREILKSQISGEKRKKLLYMRDEMDGD